MKDIIFDFDGTLANSLPVMIDIAESLLQHKITKDDVSRYKNMTVKQILKEAKIPIYKVPGLLVKGRPLLQKRMNEVIIYKGLKQVLEKLIDQNYNLYIVSSNSVGIINTFLVDNEIKQYFRKVYGNVGIFSKAQALKKVIKREMIDIDSAIYVGDEVRDIEAAKKIKIQIISVTWGYNGEQILSKYNPDFLAKSVEDILKFAKNHKKSVF